MNKFELLKENIKNKILNLDKEILQLQAKRDAYRDIEYELDKYVDKKEETHD